jgi:hypothetical protein
MALEYPSYAHKAIFVDLLAEGSSPPEPVTEQELDAWIESPGISFTTAIDLPGVGPRILKDFSPKENTYLVELESLTIVAHEQAPSKLYPALDAL